jgi:hypothetical protein
MMFLIMLYFSLSYYLFSTNWNIFLHNFIFVHPLCMARARKLTSTGVVLVKSREEKGVWKIMKWIIGGILRV